jgi:hypothetical protein
MEQFSGDQIPAHPNAGLLLRQIFDFSDVTRSVFHNAVSHRASPSLSLLLSLISVGMQVPPSVVLPGEVPLSLMLAIFNKDAGLTTMVAESLNLAELEGHSDLVLNPGSTYVVTGDIAESSKGGTPVWVHAYQPVRGITRGHGILHRVWAEGSGTPPRSHFVTCECYGSFLRQFMSISRGRLAELFVMSFPSWGCRPEEVYVPPLSPWFFAPPIPEPPNGVALCQQALSALNTGLKGTWNPALVNRVKIAALGALLHGEDYVGEDIWRWAGLVLTHSDRSRHVAQWIIQKHDEETRTNREEARR